MNRQEFLNWLDNPASLNSESVLDLQQLILDYPYFQTARMLHLINLKLTQDYRFEPELRQVAAYAADRARLKDLLGIFEKSEVGKPATREELLYQHAKNAREDSQLKNLEEMIKESLHEIELKQSRLRELIEEKKAIVGESEAQPEELKDSRINFSLRPLPKDDLLDEFIRQEKNKADVHVTFYNPEESARRSIEENDGILSETLARLVAAQGKKDKAIEIYQKLMLKNPQKSSYFAAQIEKLRKES